jgi:hypothetical protein
MSTRGTFTQLTELLQQNARTIKENETLINPMVNPNLGRSKQTLDSPVLVPAPHGHKPNHSVMNTYGTNNSSQKQITSLHGQNSQREMPYNNYTT